MKRTKRYGGFRIGDKVRYKKTLTEGDVTGFTRGYVVVDFPINDRLTQIVSLMPNQLINLTRIEEESRKITDPLPPFPKDLAEEIDKRCEAYLKIINQDDFMKDFKPTPFEDLLKKERLVPKSEMNERLKRQHNLSDKLELKQSEIFLRKLENGWLDSKGLPSPYTRDVYSSSKDF